MTGCIQDAALAPARQGFCVPNAGRGSMVARRGLDFSAAGSTAAGFGEVLHSHRAIQQQSSAVGLRWKGCLSFLYSRSAAEDFDAGQRLSFSYYIVTEQHEGNMAVTSDVDLGSTIHIELPIRDVSINGSSPNKSSIEDLESTE